MNYKKLFFFLIAGIASISLYVIPSKAMLPASAFNDPQQKEIFDFVSNLDPEQQEQLLNEIFEEVSKLPPEQQKEFWQEVEQEAIKLEEQMKQFEPAVTVPEQPVFDAPDTTKPAVKEPIVPAPAPVIVEKKELPTQDIKKAEQLLDSLIQELERFLRKITIIPGIEAKIDRWIAQGQVKNSPATTTWPTIAYDIEQVKQKLYELLERDPKTNKHKHLASLLAHENLYNNLSHLERTLAEQGPQIEVPDFGSAQITDKTKAHIQQALSGIAESLYLLKISTDLKTIVGEYEPYAQKIKKEQEELQQIARSQAGRPRVPAPLVRAGQPPVEPRTDQKTVYRPFRTEYSPPVYSPAQQQTPTAAPAAAGVPEAGKKSTGGLSAGATPSAGVSSEGKPAPSAKLETKKDDTKDKDKKDEKEKPKEAQDDLAKEYLSAIEKSLDAALDLISSTKLSAIRPYLLSNTPVDVKLATDTIPGVTALFEKAILKTRSLHSRVSNRVKDPALKKKYQETMHDIIEAYKPSFEKTANDIKNIRRAQASVPVDKQYAYLDGIVQPTDLNLLTQIPNPASLYRLQEKIDEFFKYH